MGCGDIAGIPAVSDSDVDSDTADDISEYSLSSPSDIEMLARKDKGKGKAIMAPTDPEPLVSDSESDDSDIQVLDIGGTATAQPESSSTPHIFTDLPPLPVNSYLKRDSGAILPGLSV